MSERLFCAVPARGGSERLPRKNLAPLAGRPLVAYTIEAALASGCFDEVVVCTDDDAIARVAERHGARVPALVPPELAGPLVASHQPCQWMHHHLDSAADVLVCLQPSSPLRSAADVRAGVDRFRSGDLDFLLSVTPIDPHYFHWALAGDGGAWRPFFGLEFMKERPLLPKVFRPNGSIKIARLAALAATGHFFGASLGVIETPEERSVHVATAFDLRVCEAVLVATSASRAVVDA